VFGVTYEYVRQLGLKNKLGRFGLLLEEGKPQGTTTGNSMRTQTEITTPPLPEIPDADETPRHLATTEELEAMTPAQIDEMKPVQLTHQQLDILSLSLDERVRHAVNAVLPYTKSLTPAEASDFMAQLYDGLQSELGFDVVVQVTGFGYRRTAEDLEGGTPATGLQAQ
jgi:hypothetical protein